jgi:hypothetical protein
MLTPPFDGVSYTNGKSDTPDFDLIGGRTGAGLGAWTGRAKCGSPTEGWVFPGRFKDRPGIMSARTRAIAGQIEGVECAVEDAVRGVG